MQRVVAAACQKKGGPQLFLPTVKWITYDREIPGHYALYRAAQADFNVRGWQGCWRYIAPTALFFSGRPDPPTSSYKATVIPAASSQAGDLRSEQLLAECGSHLTFGGVHFPCEIRLQETPGNP